MAQVLEIVKIIDFIIATCVRVAIPPQLLIFLSSV